MGRHLAATHCKIAVLDRAMPRDMASDRDVPRWIRKDHLGVIVSEKPDITVALQSICAEDAMISEQPKISRLRLRHRGRVERRQIVFFVIARAADGGVDLARLKAADTKVDIAAISRMSENSSFSASRSQPESSPS